MSDLKHREAKMQEARKNTPWRDCVREIGCWFPLMLYKNNQRISKYPPETKRVGKLVAPEEFEKQRDELTKYGKDYDSSQRFFVQMQQLFLSIPLAERFALGQNENTDFVEDTLNAKDSYLSFGVVSNTQNALYSFSIKDNCSHVYNSVQVVNSSENIYMAAGISKSYKVFYSRFITNSANIRFCTNLLGCQECLLCDNLENQSYCINNVQYNKEEYFQQKHKILAQKEKYLGQYKKLPKYGVNFASEDVTGDFIIESSHITNGKYVYQTNNGRNLFMVGGGKTAENMYDIILGATMQANDAYACTMFGVNSSKLYCCRHVISSSNIYYSISLENCSYCLGCIGLKNKSFCILNKQYTKEEWFKKANEIFAQMEQDGQLGKFFPASMNPFYFNDTVAYLIDDSFTKEEVEAEGHLWRDEEIKVDIPDNVETVYTNSTAKQNAINNSPSFSKRGTGGDLSDFEGFDENGNWKIDPDIMKNVIIDEKGNAYKVVKMEYDFLMKHGLPLPRLHWLDRIKLGFQFG